MWERVNNQCSWEELIHHRWHSFNCYSMRNIVINEYGVEELIHFRWDSFNGYPVWERVKNAQLCMGKN